MKELKLRYLYQGIWYYIDLRRDNTRALFELFENRNKTTHLQQFTGSQDKFGVDIYEGDILKLSEGGDVSHHLIYWDNKAGRWFDERIEDGDSGTGYMEFEFVRDCAIIGNIHENPKLIPPKP